MILEETHLTGDRDPHDPSVDRPSARKPSVNWALLRSEEPEEDEKKRAPSNGDKKSLLITKLLPLIAIENVI